MAAAVQFNMLLKSLLKYNVIASFLNYDIKLYHKLIQCSIFNVEKRHAFLKECMPFATQVCKPGSVLTAIYLALWLPIGSSRLLGTAGSALCPSTALLRDRVYSVRHITVPNPCYHGPGGLLPHLFILTLRRYISVALVLGFPPAGVTRYPYPVEPGLSSSAAFRLASAAVRPGCGNIVLQGGEKVKCLAKCFVRGYTILTKLWNEE